VPASDERQFPDVYGQLGYGRQPGADRPDEPSGQDERRSDPREFRVTVIERDQVGARFEGGQVNLSAGGTAAR